MNFFSVLQVLCCFSVCILYRMLVSVHHMGILSNRSIFGPLFPLQLNSCTYYVQYNTNPIGLLHCAIRDYSDYVIPLFSKHSKELTLSHFTRTVIGATKINGVTVTDAGCHAEVLPCVKVLKQTSLSVEPLRACCYPPFTKH